MPRCTYTAASFRRSKKLTTQCSDGKTPEEQTKQILNIAAILPGQAPQRRFSIPERKSSKKVQEGSQDTLVPTGQAGAVKQPAPAQQDDLVDFGQDDATPARSHDGAADAQGQQDLLGGDVPKPGEPGHALVPALEKMKLEHSSSDLVGMGKLRRTDSETNDVDEFVDAES